VGSGTFPGTYTFAANPLTVNGAATLNAGLTVSGVGPVIIGTDPGGTQILRVGGSATVVTDLTVGTSTSASHYVLLNAPTANTTGVVFQTGGTNSWVLARAPTNNNLELTTGPGTLVLRVLAGTNALVIGSTDPGGTGLLRVGGAMNVAASMTVGGAIENPNGGLLIRTNAPASNAAQYMQFVNSMNVMYFGIEGTAGSSLLGGATPGAIVLGNASPGRNIELFTNNVRRVTITDLQFTISTTTTRINANAAGDYAFAIGNVATTTPHIAQLAFTGNSPNSNTSNFLACVDTVGSRLIIYANGGIANFQANNVNLSDAALKDVGAVVDPAAWWDRLAALEVREFKYLDNMGAAPNIGLVAQQVQAVAPELVSASAFPSDEDSPLLGVYTSDLYHAHIAVTQELQRRILALEAKVS